MIKIGVYSPENKGRLFAWCNDPDDCLKQLKCFFKLFKGEQIKIVITNESKESEPS